MNTTTQNKRIVSVDIARGLAVFFMIAVHTLEIIVSAKEKRVTVS